MFKERIHRMCHMNVLVCYQHLLIQVGSSPDQEPVDRHSLISEVIDKRKPGMQLYTATEPT